MKKWLRIFLHTLFWAGIIAFLVFVAHNNSGKGKEPVVPLTSLLLIFGVSGGVNIALFYVNYLVLIPQFFNRKLYQKYILLTIAGIAVSGIMKYSIAAAFWPAMRPLSNEKLTFLSYFLSSLFTGIIFIFLSLVLQFTADWFTNERVQRNLENQRLTAELAFLKSQINPHFLFNSLNTIYSLAYQRSETTPEAILKLSEIMRYMLYECNDNKVDLAKELTYLQNYIDLQKIRFGSNAYVDFEVNGLITNQRIVPLLLIAFIENAFKHGVANDRAAPIKLIINLADKNLSFYMENKKHQLNRDPEGGIGLHNVKRRLDLLYQDNYKLEIHDDADTYTCELNLTL